MIKSIVEYGISTFPHIKHSFTVITLLKLALFTSFYMRSISHKKWT